MSEKPGRYSDLDIAIMLVAVPVAVLISVAVFNFLKERTERKMRSEQSELAITNDFGNLNVYRISTNIRTDIENRNTNTNTTPPTPQPIQSDLQIIFGSTHQVPSESITSIYSSSADVPITTVIQGTEEQRRLADLQNEFERRDVLTNLSALYTGTLPSVNFSLPDHTSNVMDISPNSPHPISPENHAFDRHLLPRYISQDDSLPSYEQAVLDESDIIQH